MNINDGDNSEGAGLARIAFELPDLTTTVLKEVWTTLSRALAALNPCFDAWVDGAEVFAIGMDLEKYWFESSTGNTDVYHEGHVLGFAKLDNEWSVVCCQVLIQEIINGDEPDPDRSVLPHGQPISIMDVDRNIQLQAVPYVGRLIEKVVELGKEQIAHTRQAKAFLERM
jgi:hypothetical protein